ncbi:MAG: GxxExxY protein [Anaerolineales bacterium]|uniref:GxxExxY protein n=1 Tax=Candidatus Desulfolinea nitratireducens TaxID=2841698 RepID=A0A8J6TDY1_9CHLR|nr:GxxExxY protein [Candidatus Desulfolinea nitratireducens]MBL6960735.1 GxxExxY protein [Anaerolineales bacterium]
MKKIKYTAIPADVEKVGKAVLDAAFKVHSALGPGLLESVYETTLAYELRKSGLAVENQVAVPIIYEGAKLDTAFRLDLLIENCVIVELKAVEKMNPVYEAQLLTYLRLSNIRLGYLINFYVARLKHGIKRMVV